MTSVKARNALQGDFNQRFLKANELFCTAKERMAFLFEIFAVKIGVYLSENARQIYAKRDIFQHFVAFTNVFQSASQSGRS